MDLNKEELDRAFRISFIINENHLLLNSIYESLVDREFALAQKDIKIIISDLRSIIKSIDEDDF
jgi:hypothetical protein